MDPEPLLRAVEVMDRLRSLNGCPWDAKQTHRSLTRYLVEECYEVIEAIETDDPTLLREELGDLLLQVLFHARIATEAAAPDAFGINEVASDLVDKLIRRHPHVFDPGSGSATSVDELNESWEQQKISEKGRTSAVDGVPVAQPALALAAKLSARARRAGVRPDVRDDRDDRDAMTASEQLGARLLAMVHDAVSADIDPEAALRDAARRYRAAIVAAEAKL